MNPHQFGTDLDYCEDYGHDLVTGAPYERKDRADVAPAGLGTPKGVVSVS